MAPPTKYKYRSTELQKAKEFWGEEIFNKKIKRYGSGGMYGGNRAREKWDRNYQFGSKLSPEINEALERDEFGPGFTYGMGQFSKDKMLTKQVKTIVADNPALAVELGFTEEAGRKFPKNKKESVKLLLDIKSITDTPGSAEALGIDLTKGGMTPAHWQDEGDIKRGRVAYAYQTFEDDIKEYKAETSKWGKQHGLGLDVIPPRKKTVDKIMESWKAGDSKSNIIGK